MGRKTKGRIVVAMSGGVDSAVAAALLAEQGWEVIGATMKLFCYRGPSDPRQCCSAQAVWDAQSAARKIGIRHCVVDFQDLFRREVIEPFLGEYGRGRTPNPCVWCNGRVKFAPLLEWARGIGARFIASGHYARIRRDEPGQRARLLRGRDPRKDQSYALWSLPPEILDKIRLPIGEMAKQEVRDRAASFGLAVADKTESQDICFAPRGDYANLLDEDDPEHPALAPGDIVDERGHVLGRHRGVARYTVGQRRGLGISAPAPLYAVGLDVEAKTIRVGPESALFQTCLEADQPNFFAPLETDRSTRIEAQIRYGSRPAAATATLRRDQTLRVDFDEPQKAIAPGQSVAIYRGDELLGGAVIRRGFNPPR